MKIKYTYLLILLLISNYCFSQTVIDIEADFVAFNYPSSLVFYKKTGSDLFSMTQFSAEKVNDNYLLKSETTPFIKTLRNHDSIIEVNKLLNITPTELKQNVLNKKFIKRVDLSDRQRNTSYLYLLKAESNLLFSSDLYEMLPQQSNPTWNHTRKEFMNYFFIRFNNKKLIMVLTSNHNPQKVTGFYIPVKSSSIFSFDIHGLRNPSTFNELTDDHILPDGIGFKNDIKYWRHVQYQINNKHTLHDILSGEKLIEKEFDTLFNYQDFYIGKQKESIFIYNKRLQEITPKNLRKIHFQNVNELHSRDLQVLVGNEVKWLDASGELKNETSPIIRRICGFGIEHYFLDLTITDGYYYLNNQKIFSANTYEKAYFINESPSITVTQRLVHGQYLIVKKNNKYGLLNFKTNPQSNKIEIEEILPLEYDSIKSSGDLILLQQNNLYGYFKINNKPKYKTIEPFNRYFARFTLPDGKKGWLDKDGNEYLDI